MPQFGPHNSECRIYTRRSGVLSAVGHDLELAVGTYRVEVDETPLSVRASFDARSIRVVGALERGKIVSDKPSAHDRAQIEQHVAEDVLESARHPWVEFVSTSIEADADVDGYRIRGQLRLHGVERPIEFRARRRGADMDAEVTIHQPDFGLKPFRALGGALRVHPDVRVRIRLDAFAR